MKPCISQVTTLSTSLEADFIAYGRAGFKAVELWLTKVETYLETNPLAKIRDQLDANGLTAVAAASQGGLLLSTGLERTTHFSHFLRRLAILKSLSVPTLIMVADFHRELAANDFATAAASLAEAAAIAEDHGVRLALEFRKNATFCASLDTTLALIAGSGSANIGVCFDLFHYYTGPSKFEDLEYLVPENLAWVQLCDLSGTPRELAGDADRVLPGDGDFQTTAILEKLASIGYDGYASLELLNPGLWAIPADKVADMGYQAMVRALGKYNTAGDPWGGS